MESIPLVGLKSYEYEHDLDRQALRILRSSAGFETVMKKLHEHGLDAFSKFPFLGSSYRVTEAALPDLHSVLDDACAALDIADKPELYVTAGPTVEGFAAGVDRPIIVLTSTAVDNLSPPEQRFVIGHELGHIKSSHLVYRTMAEAFPVLENLIGSATLGIGSLLSKGLEVALVNWRRVSDYTADRAGLLACQDVQVAGKVLMRLAGVPLRYANATTIEAFMFQARNMAVIDIKGVDPRLVNLFWQNQSWAVARANQLLKWFDGGDYRSVTDRTMRRCPACGRKLAGTEVFCPGCGGRLQTAPDSSEQVAASSSAKPEG